MGKVWTKDAEREQLRKIQALIEETEPDSYIRMAFCGCVKMAEENIEYDFGNSYPDMMDFRAKEIAKLTGDLVKAEEKQYKAENELNEARKTIVARDAEIDLLKERVNKTEEERDVMTECHNDLSEMIDKYEQEIMRLKAEIYDLRKGWKND